VIDLETRVSAIESSLIHIRKRLDKLAPESPASPPEQQLLPKPPEQVPPTLAGMPEFVVEAVEIAFYSVPFDRNDDGIHDGMAVYVCPTDRDGETLKRVGEVKLELIDLAADPRETLMQWEFPPQESLKHWSSIPRGYLFNLPWQGGKPPPIEEIYLKVTFTDRRGRVFTDVRKFHLTLSKPKEK